MADEKCRHKVTMTHSCLQQNNGKSTRKDQKTEYLSHSREENGYSFTEEWVEDVFRNGVP